MSANLHTIVPESDIVGISAYNFEQKLFAMINAGITNIRIDLSRVRAIDSLGIEVLIAARNSIKSQGGNFKIIHLSEHLTRRFLRDNIHELLYVHEPLTTNRSIAFGGSSRLTR